MKKITTTLLLALSFVSYSQVYYNFQQQQTTYTQLSTSASQLPYYQPNPAFYLVTLPKPIVAFGQSTDVSLTVGSGFVISTSSQYSFAFDPFIAQLADTSGSIYMEWDTLGAVKQVWIEWRDFQLEGNPVTDFVNFKVGFNLSDQSIEFHYGPMQVTDTVGFFNGNGGPQAITALLTPNFNQSYFYNALEGDPASPIHHTTPVAAFLNGAPANGTVYRFEPVDISLEENELNLRIYPNPVVDVARIEGVESGQVSIQSLDGKEIMKARVINNEINLSALPTGAYLLIIESNNSTLKTALKIMKQ
jgi:hypothetical protein